MRIFWLIVAFLLSVYSLRLPALALEAGSPTQQRPGTRSYVVRRLYQPGSTQKFNVNATIQGDLKSALFEETLPLSLELWLEINTKILSVESNGIARLQYTFRYKKQVVNYLKEEDLPKPFTETVRITPSGFPSEDDVQSKFRQSKKKATESEDNFPGIPFLPDITEWLVQFGLDVVPGPFYPMPPGAVMEGDQWRIAHLTPFLDTKGGKLSLEQGTLHTYPSTVKVIGKKEVSGRPVLHVQETCDVEVNIPLGDTLFELVRLEGRNPPKGTLKGRVKGTTNFYYALSDGALVLATGNVQHNLRGEYDRDTIAEWQPDESWAEWEVKASFRQTLAEEKTPPAPKKPAGSPKKKGKGK